MNLPFTPEQFLAVFERYNTAVWPTQIALNLLALVVIWLSARPRSGSDKAVTGILALLWMWIGAAYHLAFFSEINPGAYVFGGLNLVQGLIFLTVGFVKPTLSFRTEANRYGILGWVFVMYALVIYPLIGFSLGHGYPKTPTFGLPCPTTIFTFGVLLWTKPKISKTVLIIPLLWSVIGFSAAFSMGIREDIGLLVAGIAGSILLVLRDRRAIEAVEGAEAAPSHSSR